MNEKMKRDRVKGFLDVKDGKLVNGDGEEILLTGWGLGNWMLCEGYMWKSFGSPRFDRPRRIEATLEELAGKEYMESFWTRFHDNYITESDVRAMAEQGYNSVRVPLGYRLFMEDGEGITWVEEGFRLLDRLIDWCEKYKLYVIIDLHGAPGGQTGANIDDCIDDMPRLFMDQHNFDKGIALWERIAERYKDRWIVGGYDLLNEPLRPRRGERDTDLEYLIPRLVEFYEKAIAAIRALGDKHVFTLEGHHWATELDVFCKKYDERTILHFHRYGVMPDKDCMRPYVETARRWNFPLWLGETGENSLEWFTALYPLASEMGIGWNLWPWKKMDTDNSPCSVKMPEGWKNLIDYTRGGPHPGYEEARRMLDEYLENMKFENCVQNDKVKPAVFRQPGCTVRAVDFDEFPGKGISFSGSRREETTCRYRVGSCMKIVNTQPKRERKRGFDSMWDRFVLEMEAGEFVDYSLNDIAEGSTLQLKWRAVQDAKVVVMQDGEVLAEIAQNIAEEAVTTEKIALRASEGSRIRVSVSQGVVQIEELITE